MACNYLEQLVTEWYEHKKYFVRRNIRTREKKGGGYYVEIDILAYNPSNQHLIHIETSGAGESPESQKNSFLQKKFILSKEEYETLIGSKLNSIEKIAIVGWNKSTKSNLHWGKDIKVKLIPEIFEEILSEMKKISNSMKIISESYPILRTMQLMIKFEKKEKK